QIMRRSLRLPLCCSNTTPSVWHRLTGIDMNLEKFTDRAKGFLQSAQTVAIRMNHQRIGSEHLLKALLEDEQGMASGLIAAAGGDAKRALSEIDAALAKVPAVSGSGAQQSPGLDNDA